MTCPRLTAASATAELRCVLQPELPRLPSQAPRKGRKQALPPPPRSPALLSFHTQPAPPPVTRPNFTQSCWREAGALQGVA